MSAVKQTYQNLQIIVSDNGSGDTTPDVVSEFKDDRILFRQNVTTVDVVEHCHQFLSCAQGQYLMMLSDDDKISPGYIEAMVEVMEKWPKVTAAFGSSCTIDSQGVVKRSCMLEKTWSEPGLGFLIDLFMKRRRFPTASPFSVFARTDLVKECGGLPAFRDWSDVALMLTLALAGYVAFSEKGCFYYRVHSGEESMIMHWKDRLDSVDAFYRYLTSEPVRRLTMSLTGNELSALRRAVDYELACSYLTKLYNRNIHQMTVYEVGKALFGYPINVTYLMRLPRFFYWVLRRWPRTITS